LLTRNAPDFLKTQLPILAPDEFLALMNVANDSDASPRAHWIRSENRCGGETLYGNKPSVCGSEGKVG